MAHQDDVNDIEVARLTFRRTQLPLRRSITRSIRPNGQFDIGRADVQQMFNVSDPCISKHHLKLRCVMYGTGVDDEPTIAPLVYVKVVSKNPVVLSNSSDQNSDHHDARCIRDVDGDVLLRNGDILQLTTSVSIVFQEDHRVASSMIRLDLLRQEEARLFQDQFVLSDRELGSGGQGSVFLAFDSTSGRQVACKITELPDATSNARSTKSARETREREAYILQNVVHPNIIALEKVIFTSRNIYIFEELITAGDLLSYLERNGPLSEAQTLVIVNQLLKAVNYLHENGIVHRDIKPENVLMSSWRDGARVVLTDFGQSRAIADASTVAQTTGAQRMHTIVGTRGYVAPEMALSATVDTIQSKGYSKAVDIWSIGCITATLLTSNLIFPKDLEDITSPADQSDASLAAWDTAIIDYGPAWSAIGQNAKSFVRSCLSLDENRRPSAREGLAHVWFTDQQYAAEVEAAYDRAVQRWQPREKRDPFIEYIDTSYIVNPSSTLAYASKIAEEMHSSSPDEYRTSAYPENSDRPLPTYDSHPCRSMTPLPNVLQDSWTGRNREPIAQAGTQAEHAVSNSLQALPSISQSQGQQGNAPAQFSIEAFAPPQTQKLNLKSLNALSPNKNRKAWAPYGNLPFHHLRELHMPKKR